MGTYAEVWVLNTAVNSDPQSPGLQVLAALG